MSDVIALTPRAVAHLRRHLGGQPPGTALRVGIRRTGCSGYAYTLDYASGDAGDDHVAHCDGLAIRIARDSLAVLDGTTVDLVRDGLNEKFVFQNPNAGEACGCGESFALRA